MEMELFKDVRPKVEKIYSKGVLAERDLGVCVAIVGSRRMTNYGRMVLERIVPVLVDAGVTIVSGFMYGVDQEAHKLALENGGKTVAVLGWGIDWEVLEEDQKLYQQVAENGLILSEYEGNQKSQIWMFPQRNRIVAGISKIVIVIEAAEKSGSLITAELAVKFGKKLFAVPGPITATCSKGTNWLIKEGKALMLTSADDVLEELGLGSKTPARVTLAGGKLVKMLQLEPTSVDELAKKMKLSVESLSIELSILQLRGVIEERDGKYYVANN